MTDENTIYVTLAKDEKPLYVWILRKHDNDPTERLQGRRLEMSPAHYADLADMFANIGSEEVNNYSDDANNDGRTARKIIRSTSELMQKLAKKLRENDLHQEAATEMTERGFENPYK